MITRTKVPGRLRGEAGGIEPVREWHHRAGWRAEVEEPVAAGAAFAVSGLEHVAQWLEAVPGVMVVGHVAQSRGEALPRVGTEWHAPVVLDPCAHLVAELVVVHLTAPGADDGEARGQASLGRKRVQRRNQLALGQVAARAEDDDAERNRRARLAAPLQQRVVGGQCDAGVPAAVSAFTGWPPNSLRRAAITLLPKPSGRRD